MVGNPILRKIMACTATANLFNSMAGAIDIVFLIRVLHVRPADTGLLFGLAALGGIAGGVLSGRMARWLGSGLQRGPDQLPAVHLPAAADGPEPEPAAALT